MDELDYEQYFVDPNIQADGSLNNASNNDYDSMPLSESLRYQAQQKIPNDYFMNVVRGINRFGDKYLNPVGAGVAQMLGDTSASLANLGLSPLSDIIGKDITVPHPELRNLVEDNGMLTSALFGAGQLAGGLVPFVGAEAALARLPMLAGKGLAKTGARGALAGAALSPDEESRMISSLLGGSLGAAFASPRYLNSPIGKRIIQDAELTQKNLSNQFNNFFKQAKDAGVNKVTRRAIPKQLFDDFSSMVPKKDRKSLNKFLQEPTLENAHWAQSDLASFIRKSSRSPQNVAQTKAIDAAEEMAQRLRNAMDAQLKQAKRPELFNQYQNLRTTYREKMAPFMNSPAIRKARMQPGAEGYIMPKRLPAELMLKQNDAFREFAKQNYPELFVNRAFAGPIGKSLLGLAGLGAATKIIDTFAR